MSEMAKAYNPHEVETTLYDWWEKQGFFTPEQQVASGLADPDRSSFVISMPPPNVTGALHLGHAITTSVEDMLIRYHRMQGGPHSGCRAPTTPASPPRTWWSASWKSRASPATTGTRTLCGGGVGLESRVPWPYHGQQRRMGISCDWRRERFTLDEGLSEAVLRGVYPALQRRADL